jgi:hypothetical protein
MDPFARQAGESAGAGTSVVRKHRGMVVSAQPAQSPTFMGIESNCFLTIFGDSAGTAHALQATR